MTEKEREILLKFLWLILAMILWSVVIIACKGQEVCPAYTKGVHYHHPTV